MRPSVTSLLSWETPFVRDATAGVAPVMTALASVAGTGIEAR